MPIPWEGAKCARCQIEFERSTPVETLHGHLLHRGCYAVAETNLDCPHGCGPRKYMGGTLGYSCRWDHK